MRLTTRERECLLWLIEGKTDWEISVILGISRRAVERHMEHLRQKLGVGTRVQAVVAAFRLGLIGGGNGLNEPCQPRRAGNRSVRYGRDRRNGRAAAARGRRHHALRRLTSAL
ncbi:hypothetical protein NS226_02560 [Aureimonas ureilytica]|uniref:HTH luxR-type domain-containing protein n=1 Tax=Aureimonas ureilytica TaxID=401562 RepID=A0A175RCY0_9HYPH|nr:helix-turn-helix domain-containing protein [Aureimonas ureilytica]KTQ98008.1 hypothetical protein NS226_02560 [Aureimonas ureilytica]